MTTQQTRDVGYRLANVGMREKTEIVALDSVSFTVDREEAFGVIGPNGVGKSTLMRVLVGTLRPDEGRATETGAHREPTAMIWGVR